MKNFIDGFDVAKNKTHVSLMTFSNEAKVQFSLSDDYDAEVLKQFVDRAPHDGGETYIDKALKAADSSVFAAKEGWRPKVPSVSTHKHSPSPSCPSTPMHCKVGVLLGHVKYTP